MNLAKWQYKVNSQKLKAFLCTNNEISDTEIKEKIPFNIARRKRNEKHPNWKGGSKNVIVCRLHDSTHKKTL